MLAEMPRRTSDRIAIKAAQRIEEVSELILPLMVAKDSMIAVQCNINFVKYQCSRILNAMFSPVYFKCLDLRALSKQIPLIFK